MDQWHNLDIDDVLSQLRTNTSGLNSDEVQQRLIREGYNELVDKGMKHPLKIIFEQITSLMVVVLIAAGFLSLFLGKTLEASAIFCIIILFVTLGFLQEYRAEKAIAALKKLTVPVVRIRRDGRIQEVSARDIVSGDLVILETGNTVPADIRLTESVHLSIQESALTGESEAVEKSAAALHSSSVALGDRVNMAFMGTSVVYGRGEGVVVATGMQTEIGKIAGLIQGVKHPQTPLQKRLDRVGLMLAIAGLSVAFIIMLIGLLSGERIHDVLLTAVSVAVAVIPEGLPAILTLTLALGAQRMLKRNALIRKLPAVETLGMVTVICSDKTGTLTENKMSLTVVDVANQRLEIQEDLMQSRFSPTTGDVPIQEGEIWASPINLLLAGCALSNDAVIKVEPDKGTISGVGDSTEIALLVAAAKKGFWKDNLLKTYPRIAEHPFDSERKRMSTLHRAGNQGQAYVFVKGAVDGLLPLISGVLVGANIEPVTDELRSRIQKAHEDLASKGMRVLGFAYRSAPADEKKNNFEQDLVFVGMAGIIDPPRPEVKKAIEKCSAAGIRPIMITGDHPLTATYIAGQLGIQTGGKVLTGVELGMLSEAELSKAVDEVSVFARVAPEHKLRIVNSLQQKGHMVAMTGDGVNDAPALKKADIGVAMGITGTDVSKEAADMVLRDDNFATIVAAVEEGRSIYENIRRFVVFSVTGNISKIAFMLLWPILFAIMQIDATHIIPLLPLQLLWLNLMTDGLLGLGMGMEPAHKGAMQRPPYSLKAGIFSDGLGMQTVFIGMSEGLLALAVGYIYYSQNMPQWQSMVFLTLTFLQIGQALATKSFKDSLLKTGIWGNNILLLLIGLVSGLQVLALSVPLLRDALSLVPVSPLDFGLAAASSLLIVVIIELLKLPGRLATERPAIK